MANILSQWFDLVETFLNYDIPVCTLPTTGTSFRFAIRAEGDLINGPYKHLSVGAKAVYSNGGTNLYYP